MSSPEIVSPSQPVRRGASRRAGGRWSERLAPTAHGLPNRLVLTWFPTLVVLVYVVVVALELSGSSTGAYWPWFHTGPDPSLELGAPRLVRSDEWLVQQSWTVSQFHQDFPPLNPSLPGGTDLTLLYDVPTSHWSTLFRPQLWGYFFLGLGHGLAWQWWFAPAVTAIAAYVFSVTMLPRRPMTGALIALAAVVGPLTAWWHQSSVYYSIGWPLLAMTTMVWLVRHPARRVRVAWVTVTAYLFVTLILCFYLPFILSGIWVFVIFAVGFVADTVRRRVMPVRALCVRLGAFALAGGTAVGVIVVFLGQRREAYDLINATVYPGQRSLAMGATRGMDAGFVPLFAGPWNGAIRSVEVPNVLGPNQSEAATELMLAAFLGAGLLVLLVVGRRRLAGTVWTSVAMLAVLVVFLAVVFLPGWDSVARLMMLDKIPPARSRIAFATMLPPMVAMVVIGTQAVTPRVRLLAALAGGTSAVIVNATVYRELRNSIPNMLAADSIWRVSVVLLCLAAVLCFLPRLVGVGVMAAVVSSALVTSGVMPLYHGISDLYSSAPGREVRAVDEADPGVWVGTSFPITTGVLVESGVSTWSGTQSYPSSEMWAQIDPTGVHEDDWNRFANLTWTIGTGPVAITLVQADLINITFDPCSDFAQSNLDYVLTPATPQSPSPCLKELDTVDTPATDLDVMKIVPALGLRP